ncbi:MAG: YcaO-like family protein [Acidobacteriaceae bacterium]|nr:YcaO-like family protein [Acidobacteriaceae bacterium]
MRDLGITRVANLTGLDTLGVPVFAAIRPLSRSLVVSMGKGLTLTTARVSALMESIELWHAEHLSRISCIDSYFHLVNKGKRVIDLNGLPVVHGSQADNAAQGSWITGTSLTEGYKTLVPLDVVSMDFTQEATFRWLHRSSNGLASGNHMLEAITHALCEVIERDAEFLWRMSTDPRRVDINTITNRTAVSLVTRLQGRGAQLAIWDITSDVGIPAYACTLLDEVDQNLWRNTGVHDGFGCHLSPAVALVRAITEAAQTRLAHISGSRDDIHRVELAHTRNGDLIARVRAEMACIPATESMRQESRSEQHSFIEDVEFLLRRLSRIGCNQVIAVNLTREEIGVPVIKILVPGMEGIYGQCEPGARARRHISGLL